MVGAAAFQKCVSHHGVVGAVPTAAPPTAALAARTASVRHTLGA
jgi:hypothetical protein